jgi:hypothetical protein
MFKRIGARILNWVQQLLRIAWLSWLIFALSVIATIVLALRISYVGLVISGVVALLTFVNGARLARRVAAIEAGRYPRMRPGASRRIADRIQGETPQTVTIDGESGDDIHKVAAVLNEALISSNWHVIYIRLGGTLWDGGTGIMIYHTPAAAAAATALIEALRAENLPVSYAGDSTTGMPVHIVFRRP